jgi:uncharacterized protein
MRASFFYFSLILFIFGCKSAHKTKKMNSNAQIHAIRLRPGQDLKKEIVAYTKKQNIEAGYLITCVGSLQKGALRFANQPEATILNGKFEIVSLVGTLSAENGVHLHAAISDSTGRTIGGHLMDGNLIFTTAEIVIGEATDLRFLRKIDSLTTFKELFMEQK